MKKTNRNLSNPGSYKERLIFYRSINSSKNEAKPFAPKTNSSNRDNWPKDLVKTHV